jgi:hypothetical protein
VGSLCGCHLGAVVAPGWCRVWLGSWYWFVCVYFTISPVVWLLTPPGRAQLRLSVFLLCNETCVHLCQKKKEKKSPKQSPSLFSKGIQYAQPKSIIPNNKGNLQSWSVPLCILNQNQKYKLAFYAHRDCILLYLTSLQMTNRLHADPPVALQFMHTWTKPMQQHDSAWEWLSKGLGATGESKQHFLLVTLVRYNGCPFTKP